MAKYKELVYLILDELKITTDDSFITEDHVLFLLNKYRGLLLKRDYLNKKKEIPSSTYQSICTELILVPAIPGVPCEGGIFLRSRDKIPNFFGGINPKVHPIDYYSGEISYISKERMRHVGYNKWLLNIIYASLGPDNYLYLKSSNAQFLHLKKINILGVFDDPGELLDEDIMDIDMPLEESLIPELVLSIVKELSGMIYKPEDIRNNANDDLSDLMAYVRKHMKSDFQKQLEL